MSFQIQPLPAAPFAHLFGLPDAELAVRHIKRVTADAHPGYPCRISLRDARPGETLLLLNYEHLAADSPYRARHAIYVNESSVPAALAVDEIPQVMEHRTMSLRGFDAAGMMLGAAIATRADLAAQIEALFANPEIAEIHLHYAAAGCYAARAMRG